MIAVSWIAHPQPLTSPHLGHSGSRTRRENRPKGSRRTIRSRYPGASTQGLPVSPLPLFSSEYAQASVASVDGADQWRVPSNRRYNSYTHRPKNIPAAFGGQPIPEGGVSLEGDKEWLQKYEDMMVRRPLSPSLCFAGAGCCSCLCVAGRDM